jgi:hypothetical protein
MTLDTVTTRVVLGAALLPFLYFAARDQWLHLRARRVPLAENGVHALLGLIHAAVIARAFLFEWRFVIAGLAAFAICGAVDEFVFHRGLPAIESDVHAKEHFALFAFFAVFGLILLANNGLLPRWR